MSQRRTNRSSQLSQNNSLVEGNIEDTVNDLVRYIIYKGGEHTVFSKSDLMKNVIHKTSRYEDIITRTNEILNSVYGYNMVICDTIKGKEKSYIITNTLSHIKNTNEEDIPDDVNRILILLILAHIFMSNNSVSDVSLYSFLNSLGIDVEVDHPIFGKVKDYITKILLKKQYLQSELDIKSRRQTFKWGARAEKEVSKMAVLEFVCQIYKDRLPKDWSNQYEISRNQSLPSQTENEIVETQILDD
ncbi:melanoma-associated antigen B10-like [Sitophilus oryzae]|uniref:Melanoma-associated antigen B10-like n=1 Tax=Sitophilus oryzae TaxID=7048 RepID=A0A6J2YSP6_SITOR|nr:melanoma-associated antigen B10-like [Sitophilus oryzae]